MVKIRRCAFEAAAEQKSLDGGKPVWFRRGVKSNSCPKSIISAESSSVLEFFKIWKASGGGSIWELEAKTAAAIAVLECEWQAEKRYVEAENNIES